MEGKAHGSRAGLTYDGGDVPGNYRDTVIYNTFVWMQLFNEINCR